ncbi:MAG: glycosyltransferase family 2 protein [Acidobacteria bacterium]|nr:glycosyltransferase family 2 protein [Acidobacteriota bacterium]
MKPPDVSVIIPTFNRRALLEEAVESVLAQSIAGWELIVIDDASTDDTWPYLETLRDSRVRLFRQAANAERSAARNRGLAEARGEFIVFLDDDDRLRPTALARLNGALRANPRAVAAVGGRWKFRPGEFGVQIPHSPVPACRVIWPELLAGWSAVSGQNMFRAEVVRKVGGFPLGMSIVEDRKLWLNVAYQGPVAIVPRTTVEYRDYPGQRRPADIRELREQVYWEFIGNLPSKDVARGEQALVAGTLVEEAAEAYDQGRCALALLMYGKAFCRNARLWASPLTGPLWLRGLAKALVSPLWRPRVLGRD